MPDNCYHCTLCVSFFCLICFIGFSLVVISLPSHVDENTFTATSRSRLSINRPLKYVNHPCYVDTTTGPIAGQLIYFHGRQVCQFIGIPYAQAPIGKLRFMKPLPINTKWRNVIEENQFKPSCPQEFPNWAKHMMRPTTNETNEDCLYLNIWQPVYDESSPRKSIIMWIHGGGFQFGSGTLDETNGTALAAHEDVIVVTINYRLNALGFLNIPDSPISGNMGLYDQATALNWIHENSHLFNGNHHSITLWGQGMGAISITGHLVSHLTRNKFKRAIIQTGSIFTMPMTYTQYEQVSRDFILSIDPCSKILLQKETLDNSNDDESEASEGHYAFENSDDSDNDDHSLRDEDDTDDDGDDDHRLEKQGQPKETTHTSSDRKKTNHLEEENSQVISNNVDEILVKCLQDVSIDQIINAVNKINSGNPISFMFSPYEHFFNNSSPLEMKSNLGNFFSATVKDLLFGFNSDEGTLLLNSLDGETFPDSREPNFNDSNDARDTLIHLFADKLNVPKSILHTGVNAAFSDLQSVDNTSLVKCMADFTGNNMFVCPTITYADQVAQSKLLDPESIHLFVFNGRSEYNLLPKWYGTIHNEEVPIMFGYPLRYPNSFSTASISLSRLLMNTVAIFAKSGYEFR